MGGTSNVTVNALVIRNNKIYVAGETASSNFNLMITGNIKPSQITLNGQTDAFVAVFDQFFNRMPAAPHIWAAALTRRRWRWRLTAMALDRGRTHLLHRLPCYHFQQPTTNQQRQY